MKRIILAGLVLSMLTGCGGDDSTSTPKGVITRAAKALSKGQTQDFLSLLTGPALEKLQTPDQQLALKNSLGNIKKIKLSEPRVESVVGDYNDQTTLYTVDVLRDSQIIQQASVVCRRTVSSSTHLYCPPPPSHNDRPDPWPGNGGGHSGGGHSGGGHSGGGGSGGGLTPGPSNPGGNGDPNRPPRFPGFVTESHERSDGCYDVVDHYTNVSCRIKDVR